MFENNYANKCYWHADISCKTQSENEFCSSVKVCKFAASVIRVPVYKWEIEVSFEVCANPTLGATHFNMIFSIEFSVLFVRKNFMFPLSFLFTVGNICEHI